MGLAGLSIAMFGASANAEVESEFTVGYHSEYVFRGASIGEDMMDFALDFAGTGYCDFDWSAGIWFGSWDPNDLDPDPDEDFYDYEDELNIYGGISRTFNCVTLELGFIRYIFIDDNGAGNTELYFSASTEFNNFGLGATVYYNVDAERDSSTSTGDVYADITATYGFDFTDTLSGEFGAMVGFYDRDNDISEDDGYAHWGAYLSLSQQISDCITLTPYISYVDNDDDYNSEDDDLFYGGLRATYSF